MVKILLVEDNEMKRDMLSRWLKRKGYEVFIAVDGQEGVNMATSESTSVILLDMSLPIMDGWEAAQLLERVRRSEDLSEAPQLYKVFKKEFKRLLEHLNSLPPPSA